jgi:hypothetical protein
MSCSADPLTVPAHRVITLAVGWEAHDLDKGLVSSAEHVAGIACIDCGTEYRQHPQWPQVVVGLAEGGQDPVPLAACRGTCAARHGSATGTGQPVPPIENRILLLKQLTAGN